MKSKLITVIALLLLNLLAKGQNLFLIGEKSYFCTDPITLESNTNNRYEDLETYLAKDDISGYFAMSRKTPSPEKISGKLIIYLQDGNVITCTQSVASEKVDDRAKALYVLTSDQINQLKVSNIHTVKYTMYRIESVNYSASNKGIETREIISNFFSPEEKKSEATETANDPIEPALSHNIVEEKPFTYVDQMPTFPGGTEGMYTFIYDKLKYPAIARENGTSGQVIVDFVVSKNGDILNPRVVRGIGGGCNEEALRVVNAMPKWIPGKHNGQNVAVTYTLPIKFVLQ